MTDMVDRTATSTLFGFDFQTNAAIVLMLDNIKDMSDIKMEGYEDVEIRLSDGSSVLAQAKSAVNGSTDFSKALPNLKKAMESLSDAYSKCPSTKQLIYISNSANPLSIPSEKQIFLGVSSRRSYDSLPGKSKKRIDDILSSIKGPFDKSKLLIQTFYFETDDEKERNKYVVDYVIKDFITTIGINSVTPSELHKIWHYDIFKSGTKRDSRLKLTKNDVIWPVIVLATNNMNFDDEDLDDSETEEITRLYKDVINLCTEKYEFVTKVLYAYNVFYEGTKKERAGLFINSHYKDYLYLLDDVTMNDDIKECLIKIILRNVLNKRIQINRIKEATKL